MDASGTTITLTTVNGNIRVLDNDNNIPLPDAVPTPTPTEPSKTDTIDKPKPPLFSDVPQGFWAFQYINNLAELGVVSGVGDGAYNPGGWVSRAELVKILAGVMGVDVNDCGVTPFLGGAGTA